MSVAVLPAGVIARVKPQRKATWGLQRRMACQQCCWQAKGFQLLQKGLL